MLFGAQKIEILKTETERKKPIHKNKNRCNAAKKRGAFCPQCGQ
jgi:hypothetical protein